MKKKAVVAVAVVAVVVAAIVWKFTHSVPLPVWVVEVEQGPVEASVANTRAGTVKACRRSRLSMPIGGVVDRLLVTEGDRVEQGQLLLELWNRDRQAEVNQAEQTLQATRHERDSACLQAEHKARESERVKRLVARRLTSEENADIAATAANAQQRACEAAKHQTGVAEARLALQQAVLERTRLHAPFAGVVAEVNGEQGEYITPSPPGIPTPAAVDLIDYNCLYVTAPIDEIDAGRLAVGLPARVTLDAYRDQDLSGTVTQIAPYVLDLEKQARTVDVDVRLDDLPEGVKLLVGYSADITVILDAREQALRLPTEAILPDDSVWVLGEDQTLSKRNIERGLSNWSYTEVVSGLSVGERVVSSPDKPGIDDGVTAVAVDD
ncbi:efflux RND transporter periplasmic adaptor subunit [Spongiibacter nanhainus]|uniref:Efflux RND transporter periplasmic adaptor subunit n=1 Tax=Spongiibacter nanhainus TaxID=2794344 RepID=A0A7T4USR3_9GAMM|nr:efflux RND transporter periplasmic adaptor subunit [Spongiibacter nanhainus]QQD19700.1 efflux RND transporter periplasmic adaptor subunit [Spongiibacter nanhainus]